MHARLPVCVLGHERQVVMTAAAVVVEAQQQQRPLFAPLLA
jgi:hypothetical protein